jgi:hypothetical protein
MPKPVYRKKRNKTTRILLAPIFAIFFLVGWSLSWIGDPGHKKKQKPINKTPKKQDTLELIVIPEEEQILTA